MDTPRNVYLCLSTYVNLQEEGEKVLRFLEGALELMTTGLAFSPDRVVMHGEPAGGFRNRQFLFNAKNWARLKQELLDGKLMTFRLTAEFDAASDADRLMPLVAEATVNIWSLIRPDEHGIASTLDLGVSRYLYGSQPAKEWQVHWVELGCEAFALLPGANGFLTVDYFTPGYLATYLEQRYMLAWEPIGTNFGTNLRGYYWGNWLGPEHIVRLGGLDSIKREAPCFLVRPLFVDDHEMAFLQLTSDVDQFSDQELRALRSYLENVLPAQNRRPFALTAGSLLPRLVKEDL